MIDIEIIDNSDFVKEELQVAVLRALEECGLAAENHAKDAAPVDTGKLRADISHAVDESESAVYIGTTKEVPYAVNQELGTFKMPAHPFLKPAVADHAGEYLQIIEGELKNG